MRTDMRASIPWRAAAAVVAGVLLARPSSVAGNRADELFETATSAFRLERWEDAAVRFYDFMAEAPHDPRNPEAQYFTARAFMHRNYLQRAIQEFSHLVEDFPESPFALPGYHDRAQCHVRTREIPKAVADFEAVVRIPVEIWRGEHDKDRMRRQRYENHRASVFWLERHYLDRGEHERAITALSRLPHPIEAFRRIVEIRYALGQTDIIREMIDALQGQNRHEGFKFLIEFYARIKAYNQFAEIFSKLLRETDPDRHIDDLVWTTAANFIHFGRERWDWAMRQVSAHYPRMARRAEFELAGHYWQQASYMDELELFALRYREGNDVNAVLRWKGIMHERQGEVAEARATYRRMSDVPIGHWFAAEAYDGPHAREKDIEKAIAEYAAIRTAFYSEVWSAWAQWRIAERLAGLKRIDDAVEAYRQVVERFGEWTVEPHTHQGWHHYRITVPVRAYGPDALLAAGDLLREHNRPEDAMLEYAELIRRYGRTEQAAWAAYRTALCWEAMDEHEMAVAVLKSTIRRYTRTIAAGDAHSRLEGVYQIPDDEVANALDVLDAILEHGKNYLEDTNKGTRR